MKTLVFNGAGAGVKSTNMVALLCDETVLFQSDLPGRGASEHFAPITQTMLRQAGKGFRPEQIVAVVGPGSFTGLRASLALAAGLAAGWGCPARGVTLGAAMRATLGRDDITCVTIARRGRFFVDPPGGEVFSTPEDQMDPTGWYGVAGDAVEAYPSWPCEVLHCAVPTVQGIVKAASEGAARILRPLYVDPPEAKPPSAGLRPSPR